MSDTYRISQSGCPNCNAEFQVYKYGGLIATFYTKYDATDYVTLLERAAADTINRVVDESPGCASPSPEFSGEGQIGERPQELKKAWQDLCALNQQAADWQSERIQAAIVDRHCHVCGLEPLACVADGDAWPSVLVHDRCRPEFERRAEEALSRPHRFRSDEAREAAVPSTLSPAIDSSARDVYEVWHETVHGRKPLSLWQDRPEIHAQFASWLRSLADRVMPAKCEHHYCLASGKCCKCGTPAPPIGKVFT